MTPVKMHRDLRYMRSDGDLSDWLHRERVDAIYVDSSLRDYEPSVWQLVRARIGKELVVGFGENGESVEVLLVRGHA